MTDDEITVYEAVGGEPFFTRLVDAFYREVEADPQVRAIYPEDDLGPANLRLRMFLEQYWGGPATYSEQRGHPRLRMRHAPYPIDAAMRDRWLAAMGTALREQELPQPVAELMWQYFTMAAVSMENVPDGDPVLRAFEQSQGQ